MTNTSLVGRYKNTLHFINSLIQVVVNRYPARKLYVIGITGTDGKTTTAHLVYEILKNAGKKVALLSTVAAYIDGETLDTGYHVTTPDPKYLQPLLKKISDNGIKYFVLEATSHGLDQHRVLGCNFKIGVLTNVTHEHLDYHKSFERYKKAKAKLFGGVEYGVLNKDDPSFKFFRKSLKKEASAISYSMSKPATLKASNIKFNSNGMKFTVTKNNKKTIVSTPLVGKYNASNILAACGAARVVGIGWGVILKTLKEFKGVKGRLEVIDKGQPFTVLVDFAHTPNALESVLLSLRGVKNDKKLIVVFGCAGERDYLKRPIMGDISTRLADVSIFTAEDPRHEDVNIIINAIGKGAKDKFAKEVKKTEKLKFNKNKHLFVKIPDRKEAIKYAIQNITQKGDIVVLCGKGHEKSMSYKGVEHRWSDRKAAEQALEGMGYAKN